MRKKNEGREIRRPALGEQIIWWEVFWSLSSFFMAGHAIFWHEFDPLS